ncbi:MULTISPECIES: translation elongation factor Ts [Sphingomonadales]|uniref:Elongation factor Ts n=1 Tax=Edaphosphingomonas haloaromaticamans TaxID=653954 RepID=A0A1S1HHW8_9SPHN|nr:MULTISPECIES: translation elongation factor Ts [Sphingomonas]AGH48584.1 elongation factor Ts [Sphingomonas sp. MM-1]MDX3883237.1 translation elongation factor Ts [Sphingomonas sp.]OHT21061.1 Elongation factor Ts [Sphingomonas haloaromaticamans]
MAEVTAKTVKELRDRTGAGMMDCKKALAETNGDMEAAVDWLRTKGLAAAAKKAGRQAAEGLVGVTVKGTKGAVVEVNSETDFVAKNDQFQSFVKTVTELALDTGDSIEALAAATYPGEGTVAEKLTSNIATIGEQQALRRAATLTVDQGAIVSYVHNAAAPGLGKIGVLVALESAAPADKLEALGKQLAMHIAAAAPLALTADGLDAETIERERAIATEKAAESGKPANIVEKMVEGAIAKYRKENALVSQAFVIDGKTPVADVVAAAGKEAGSPIVLKGYVRFQLGEGIEKKESDFAAEVAAAAGV